MRSNPIEFNGIKFYKTKRGYYMSDYKKRNQTNSRLLYRCIWEHHNGVIPEGYQIHHINEDTR